MRPLRTALMAAAAMIAAAGVAQAQPGPPGGGGGGGPSGCLLQLQPTLQRWVVRSDGLTGQPVAGQFEIAYVNNSGVTCQADLVVELQGDRFGLEGEGQARVPYDLTDDISGADITPRAGSTVRSKRGQSVQVPPGERLIRQYTFLAHPGPAKGDGAYEQIVQFCVEEPSGLSLGCTPITLALDLTPTALMGLKGAFQRTGSGARIDLGELTTGGRNLPVEVYVISSRGYRLTVSSQNLGELRLVTGGDWSVPYDLYLGAHAVNLRTGGGFEVTAPGAHDDSYPLGVVIGDVTGKRAGAYSDVVTMTVAAL